MNTSSLNKQSGFTLIEVMITMVIALVILAGMSSLFVSQTKTSQVLGQKSEIMNDLFLVSQIMQAELRGAKAICWNSTDKLMLYQPLTSADNLTASCTETTANNGYFRMNPVDTSNGKPSPYICWDRPNKNDNCQEMVRGMKYPSGMTVNPTGNTDLQAVRTITLTAQYKDRDHQTKDLTLSFKVWPRNTQ